MSSIWKINGTDAASLGINRLSLKQVSQGAAEFSFRIPGAMDATVSYPYRSELTLHRNSDCWFRGVVITLPRSGSPRAEHVEIVAQDAWWYLEQIVFEQDWAVYASGAVTSASKARCILGRDADGNIQTNGQVIREVLQWAIDSGAPIAIGTIDLDAQIPADEVQDLTCSQVIQRMIRWAPDCVCYWTYPASTPTFHCRYRRNLTAATFALSAGSPNSEINITARPDLVLPAVVLKYERTDTVNNQSYSALTVDKYPLTASGREIGAFVGTVNLAGFSQSSMYQQVKTEDIQTDDLAWWKLKFPWMADAAKTKNITFHSVTRSGAKCPDGVDGSGNIQYKLLNGLPREVKDGQVVDWMQKDAGEETISATFAYTRVNEDGTEEEVEGQNLNVTITATDATNRVYWRQTSYTSGDVIPSGLAQKLYASNSELHYQGSVSIVEQECTGIYTVGKVLNITGGRPEWTSMRALIQSVIFDLDAGRTTVNFGPPTHLGFADLVELLKTTRRIVTPSFQAGRSMASLSDSDNTIPGGQNAPRSNSTSGLPQYAKMVVRKGEKAIVIDPSAEETELTIFTYLELQDDGIHTKQRKLKFYGSTPYEIGPEETGPTLPGGPCPNGT